jgi:hypothetical protein
MKRSFIEILYLSILSSLTYFWQFVFLSLKMVFLMVYFISMKRKTNFRGLVFQLIAYTFSCNSQRAHAAEPTGKIQACFICIPCRKTGIVYLLG